MPYLVKRLINFVVVIWVAASVNFLVPRLAPGDPIGAMIGRMSMQGASVAGSAEIIAHYRALFGLDEPLWVQYGRYMGSLLQFDLGVSLSNFPTRVIDIIAGALPWTLGLLVTTTLLSFGIGSVLGALLVWKRDAGWLKVLVGPFVVLGAIPYYLFAILLLFLLAFWLKWLPSSGTSTIGSANGFSFDAVLDTIYHSLLPALSIILTSIGGWLLIMRGTMVNVVGADYLLLARAKGLKEGRLFARYAMRNALLPQVTTLAITLGSVVSGAALVEIIFSYPGLGYVLYRAINNSDYTVIQGVAFVLVVAVALSILVLDLIYPLLDPRIRSGR